MLGFGANTEITNAQNLKAHQLALEGRHPEISSAILNYKSRTESRSRSSSTNDEQDTVSNNLPPPISTPNLQVLPLSLPPNDLLPPPVTDSLPPPVAIFLPPPVIDSLPPPVAESLPPPVANSLPPSISDFPSLPRSPSPQNLSTLPNHQMATTPNSSLPSSIRRLSNPPQIILPSPTPTPPVQSNSLPKHVASPNLTQPKMNPKLTQLKKEFSSIEAELASVDKEISKLTAQKDASQGPALQQLRSQLNALELKKLDLEERQLTLEEQIFEEESK